MKRISLKLTIDEDDYKELKLLSERKRISIAEIVRGFIEKGLYPMMPLTKLNIVDNRINEILNYTSMLRNIVANNLIELVKKDGA